MSNLRDRASAAQNPGAEVERQSTLPTEQTLKGQIERMEAEFRKAMPQGAEAKQLVRDAVTALQTVRNLDKADAKSVLGALMTCAQLGLRPGVQGQAWVLPFWDRHSRSHKAQLIIGYKGLIELGYRSDRIESIVARTVYERDEFEVTQGTREDIVHRPYLDGDPGEAIRYYAIVRLKSGGHAHWVMSKWQAEKHRDDNAMARNKQGEVIGPWRDHFDAMAMKTCIIKLARYMPQSTEIATAISVDQGVRVDVMPERDAAQVTHHIEPMPDGQPALQGQSRQAELRAKIRAAAAAHGVEDASLPGRFAERFDGLHIDSASVEQYEDFLTAIEGGSYDSPEPIPDEPPAEPQGAEEDPESEAADQ